MIRLKYLSNIRRCDIGEFDFVELDTDEDYINYIREIVVQKGFSVLPYDNLYIIIENQMIPFTKELLSKTSDATILYSSVVAASNAAEYARLNGIVFFFHTDEQSHLYSPHIHARYSGQEISIYLQGFRVKGSFENGQKQRQAVQFVKRNAKDILDEWNKIMRALNRPTTKLDF